jgi:hypothetical protein
MKVGCVTFVLNVEFVNQTGSSGGSAVHRPSLWTVSDIYQILLFLELVTLTTT